MTGDPAPKQRPVTTYKLPGLLRWAGSKRTLLPELVARLPSDWATRAYLEPFFGAGALFFALRPKNALLSDANPHLVNMYNQLVVRPENVMRLLGVFAGVDGCEGEQSYLRLREEFNSGEHTGTPREAALFIYLNKTCFNGLFRTNKAGGFNVPYGKRKRPNIDDLGGVQVVSEVLRTTNAQVMRRDFSYLLRLSGDNSFIYVDPPYVPVSGTASFTSYGPEGFTTDDHRRLADACKSASLRGAKLLISNSDTALVRELYAGFHMDLVSGRRSVSAKGTSRGSVNELLIRNY